MTPFTFPFDVQRQAVELATETVERADAAPEAADRFAGVEVGQTPSEVVYRENKLALHHYHPETVGAEVEHDVPILVVYALINRPYILDLQPDRSVLRRLLEAGFEVYMIDWGEPSQLDTSLTLDDYVNRYVDRCVDVAREETGVDRVHLLGYCMGGTMSAMYTALHPEKVRTLGLMAAGLCFDGTGGVLEKWGDEQFYDPADVVETFGNVPADFLAVGFDLMDPVNNYVTKYLNLYENLDDEEFVENFARMEKWISDGIDVAGETYREFLEEVYQDNALYENDLVVGGEPVDLDRIDVPVLQVVGEYDHLIPPEASTPFNDVVGSDDVTAMEFPTGHIGLSVSSRSHEELWPAVADWYAERSTVEAAETVADEDGPDGATDESDGGTADESEPDAGADAAADDEVAPADADVEDGPDVTIGDDEADDLQLVSVRGVGPTYADALRSAGIESVTDLATADPAELAAATDIPEGRLRDIVEDARDRVDD